MPESKTPTERRAAFLPLFLAGGLVAFISLILILLTGGLFLYVLLFVAAFVSLGSLHWMLWGAALTARTAGEREEMEMLERARQGEE